MPKMKTHSGAKKRFKVTGSGKLKRHNACSSHLKRKRSTKAKRNLRQASMVSAADTPRMKALLCI